MVFEYVCFCLVIGVGVLMFIKGINLNITVNVDHKYPDTNFVEIQDNYNEEGDPKTEDSAVQDFNEALKSIHDFMVDSEE